MRYQAALHPDWSVDPFSIPVQEGQDLAELVFHLEQDVARFVVAFLGRLGLIRHRPRCRTLAAGFGFELLLRTGDREALVVEQLLDAQDRLDVLAPIDALAGAVLGRRQGRELRLPVAQDVRLGVGDLADLTDLEKQLVGDRLIPRER